MLRKKGASSPARPAQGLRLMDEMFCSDAEDQCSMFHCRRLPWAVELTEADICHHKLQYFVRTVVSLDAHFFQFKSLSNVAICQPCRPRSSGRAKKSLR
jgi:hypothetical protein